MDVGFSDRHRPPPLLKDPHKRSRNYSSAYRILADHRQCFCTMEALAALRLKSREKALPPHGTSTLTVDSRFRGKGRVRTEALPRRRRTRSTPNGAGITPQQPLRPFSPSAIRACAFTLC